MNAAELARALIQAKTDIEDAMTNHARLVQESATADRAMWLAKAGAYLAASGSVDVLAYHLRGLCRALGVSPPVGLR